MTFRPGSRLDNFGTIRRGPYDFLFVRSINFWHVWSHKLLKNDTDFIHHAYRVILKSRCIANIICTNIHGPTHDDVVIEYGIIDSRSNSSFQISMWSFLQGHWRRNFSTVCDRAQFRIWRCMSAWFPESLVHIYTVEIFQKCGSLR